MRQTDLDVADRYPVALEFVEELRANRRFPTELVDSVQDGLIDLLQRRPDFGRTRGALFALGRRQLDWRIKDWQRKRFHADGEAKAHPAAARSLDQEVARIDGDGGNLYDSLADRSSHGPERLYLGKEELGELIERAREDGLNALRVIQAEIRGTTPQELAASVGVEVNTVHQWQSRYRARRRRESK